MIITLRGGPCDRCGKENEELHAYKFSEVGYRGRKIEHPWLCPKCFMIVKEKAWKAWKAWKANGAPKGEPWTP